MNNMKFYLYLFGATFLWGLQPVMMKILLMQYTTITVVVVRCFLMIICYFSLVYLNNSTIKIPTKKQILILIFIGFCSIPLNNITQFEGLHYTTAFNCTLLGATVPAMVAILAYFILREHLSGIQWIGIVISFMGICYMLSHGNIDNLLNSKFNIGDILILISEIGWSLYIVFSRQVMQLLSPLQTSAWANLFGTLILLPYVFNSGQFSLYYPSMNSVIALVYVVLFSGVMAGILWNVGVKYIGASKSAIFSNVTPVTGLIFGNLILNEAFGIDEIVGIVIVGIGVYLLISLRPKIF